MIFSEKSVEGLLSGRKTQSRRLVKDGEMLVPNDTYKEGNVFLKSDVVVHKFRPKWRVNKDYSVQLGRGRKGLSFRVKIVGIRKERLLDISEEDAKREGYKNIWDFISAFCNLNKIIPNAYEALMVSNGEITFSNTKLKKRIKEYYNPFVWVLSVEVMK
jgi:hypothetical protein